MRSLVLLGMVLLAVTQALPLALTHNSPEIHARLQQSGSEIDGAIASSGTLAVYDTSRQPLKRDCGLPADQLDRLKKDLEKAKGWAHDLEQDAQSRYDAFVKSDGVSQWKVKATKAQELLDLAKDSDAADTAQQLKDEAQNFFDKIKESDSFQALKDKAEELFDKVKKEGEDLIVIAKNKGNEVKQEAQDALDKATACDPKPKPDFNAFRFGH